jgi:hypothetical protein
LPVQVVVGENVVVDKNQPADAGPGEQVDDEATKSATANDSGCGIKKPRLAVQAQSPYGSFIAGRANPLAASPGFDFTWRHFVALCKFPACLPGDGFSTLSIFCCRIQQVIHPLFRHPYDLHSKTGSEATSILFDSITD